MVPGSSFACPGYVRLAYCVSYDTIINSLPEFKKLAEEFGLWKRREIDIGTTTISGGTRLAPTVTARFPAANTWQKKKHNR